MKLNLEPAPEGLPADIEHNLVRIAQEAVTNSVKHSGARTIEVMLRSTPSRSDSRYRTMARDSSAATTPMAPAGITG